MKAGQSFAGKGAGLFRSLLAGHQDPETDYGCYMSKGGKVQAWLQVEGDSTKTDAARDCLHLDRLRPRKCLRFGFHSSVTGLGVVL